MTKTAAAIAAEIAEIKAGDKKQPQKLSKLYADLVDVVTLGGMVEAAYSEPATVDNPGDRQILAAAMIAKHYEQHGANTKNLAGLEHKFPEFYDSYKVMCSDAGDESLVTKAHEAERRWKECRQDLQEQRSKVKQMTEEIYSLTTRLKANGVPV